MPGRSNQIIRRIIRGGVILALVVFSAASVIAGEQSTSSILKEYRQRVWTKEDGLQNNCVMSVLQTRDGYLWVGTLRGVVRFDGQRFVVFDSQNSPLPEDFSRIDFAKDSNGNLWIGTQAGLYRFREGEFMRFTAKEGLWNNEVGILHLGKSGILWIGTLSGLNKLHDGQLSRLVTHDWMPEATRAIHGLWEEESGILWIVTAHAVQKRNLATWEHEVVFGLESGLSFTPLRRDASGSFWLGANYSLHQFADGRWMRHPQDYGPKGSLAFIMDDSRGNLWFGTGVVGLGRFANGKFSHLDSRDGLPDDWVRCLSEDHEGNLWLGTHDAGLVCWQPRRFTTYTTQDGLPDDDVRTIFESQDGSVWIGTEVGLCQFKDGKFTTHQRESGPKNSIRSIAQDSKGALWLGTQGAGVACLRDGRFTDYPLPGNDRYNNIVRSLAIGNDDSVWIGTGLGLYRLSQGRLSAIAATNALLEHVEIWGLHFDRAGNLWVGSYGVACISSEGVKAAGPASDWSAGLRPGGMLITTNAPDRRPALRPGSTNESRLRPSEAAAVAQSGFEAIQPARILIPASEVNVFTSTNGLSSDANWALHEDKEGVIWIGNESGLNRLKDGRVFVFTKREGLPDDRIEEILEDDLGNFWIAWERGVFRVAKAELNQVAEGKANFVRCVAYDEKDTLPNARINGRKSHPAGCKTRDGRLWLPTTKGVVVFDPQKIIEKDSPPPVIMESVRANGKAIFGDLDAEGKPVASGQWSGISGQLPVASGRKAGVRNDSQPSTLKLQLRLPAANARVMEFDYTACDLTGGGKSRFKYRLEGFDKDWVDAGGRRRAFYTNLRPGDYRFKVIACNHNGVWNETGASLAFYLAPHFYQTKAFFALSGLAIGLAGFGIHQVRVRVLKRIHNLERQKAMAQERTRIAQDIHDDLGARLTQIDLLTELAKRDLEPQHAAVGHVQKIGARSQEISQSVDEIVWALNAKNDNLRGLLAYVRAWIQEYLGGTGLEPRFDWPEMIPEIHVKAEVRHNLFLVIKEALNNVIQHARAKDVSILVALTGSALRVEVADDGCGFTTADVEESGNGLRNMETRVTSLGGQFQIESRPGAGTKIRLSVNL